MKKKEIPIIRIDYIDSLLLDEQTDEIAKPQEVTAIGFVVTETKDYITIARELIGKEYRGQVSIPKKSFNGSGQVGVIQEGEK